MVNKIVFDYLSQNHGKYNLEDLKKKILSAGYSQQDIDEALKTLGLEGNFAQKPINNGLDSPVQKNAQINASSTNNPSVDDSVKKEQQINYENYKPSDKKFKWMKFSGIIGLIYFLTAVLFSIILLVYKNSLNEASYFAYAFLGIGFILFIFFFFFLYGFVKMGKYTNSGLLRFASKSLMILIILGILLILGAAVFLVFIVEDSLNQIASFAVSGDITQIMPFLSSLGTSSADYFWIFIVMSVIFIIFLLFGLIVAFCFFIGLIHAGNEVRFAKGAGMLGILFLIVMIIAPLGFSAINLIYSDINLSSILPMILLIIFGILGFLGFLIYLFIVLGFFNASRKFESGYI